MSQSSDSPDTSTNDDVNLMSPHGDTMDALLVRARCCRDWPVLAMTRIGRCGYCGQVPVVVGSW